MKQILRIVLFGAGVWAIPFAFGMLVFPLQASMPALFDTLMSIGIAVAATLFGGLFFRKQSAVSMRRALTVGLAWMAICLVIDLPILVAGLGMSLTSYFADIGLTYLIVPIIVVGMAYAFGLSQLREA